MPLYKLSILLVLVMIASGVTIFAVQTLLPLNGLSPLWTGLTLLVVVAITVAIRLWPAKSRDDEHP
jgi:hypothetical protein